MLNILARMDAARHERPAPAHHNDNRLNGRPAARQATRPQRLACHWHSGATDGRLECHWQIELADETEAPGPSFRSRTVALVVRVAANVATRRRTDGRAA